LSPGFYYVREIDTLSATTVATRQSSVEAKRLLVALDYDLAGNELRLEYVRYSTGAFRTTNFSGPHRNWVTRGELTGAGSYGALNSQSGPYYTEYEWLPGLVNWEVRVNGRVLIALQGGIVQGETRSPGYIRRRDTYSWESILSAGNVASYYSFDEEFSASHVFTERAWLVDIDMRYGSACYIVSTAYYSILPAGSEKPSHMEDIQLGTMTSCETFMVHIQNWEEVARVPVEAVAPTGAANLVGGYTLFQLCPRLFGFYDGYEWDMNSPQIIDAYFSVNRFWAVKPFERYPNRRIWGALSNRNGAFACSFDDRSLVRTGPEGDQPRTLTPYSVIGRGSSALSITDLAQSGQVNPILSF
jgi:hypothetical protein